MINIITSFFVSKIVNPCIEHRNQELVNTLMRNINSPVIDKIHLFVDDELSLQKLNSLFIDSINSGKINIISFGKQPLYYDFFDYATRHLTDKICMVTNSDIYIDQCDMSLIEKLNTDVKLLYALTRHEHDMSCPLINNYHGSHDSFIFKSPLNNISIETLKFPQNVWGSEAKLLSELYKQGIVIKNPCHQIKIVHLHESNIREHNRITIKIHTSDNPEVHFPPIHL
jgi:hypothetical protein